MKHFRLLAMLLVAATLVFMACSDDGIEYGGTTSVTYAIGDPGPSGVGIVFYVTDGGLHGLEVAPVDQSTGAIWSTKTTNLWTSAAIGYGSVNTDKIIDQNNGADCAAQICRDYRLAEEGDWFLPSKYELQEIWWNLVSDQSLDNSGRGKPHAGSLGGFAFGYYWSSTEHDAGVACNQSFNDGNQMVSLKSNPIMVRAVRAF